MKVFSANFLRVITGLFVIIFITSVARASSTAVSAGSPVTLTATADGTDPFTYQWYKDGNALSGATNSTYAIGNFQASNVGTYSTVISNSAGSTTTDNATLTLAIANAIPVFTTQPSSQTVTAGNAVTFTAAASGTPAPTFQWQKNSVNILGANSSSYSLSSPAVGDAGSYTIIATNSAGAVTSNTATLTVNPLTVAPAFTSQPSSQTVTAGAAVTFTAAANGTPAPTFQWQKNGTNISGATNVSHTLSNTAAGDAGSYTVVATNSAGSSTSNTATLTVNIPTVAPTITTHPTGQAANTGGSVTFTVLAAGTPSPTYQWRSNGAIIPGATGASYTMTNVTVANAATYTVVVTNSAGSITSNGALLTINTSPAFTTQPVSQAVAVGGSVTFTATASGTPAPTFQWKKNGSTVSGATSASYTISGLTTANAGTYTVVATNTVASVTSNGAVLTTNNAPAFTTQPASQTVTSGGSVTFTAAASGTPTPTFQWKKDGTTISGATNASYTISGLTTTNAGSYTVVATNSVGSVTSNGAALTINSTPAFTTQPASQTVAAGTSVTFTAAASGSPSPTFQWKKNGTAISGATNSTYTLSNTAVGDAGSYTVVATNSVGAVTSSTATLTINNAPTFTTHPASQTVIAGTSATFTAAATGSPNPTYQWKKSGANISGATSATYTLSSVTAGNAGSYTVVATNSVGAVTSNLATLTVNPVPAAPVFTTQPANQSVIAGAPATLTAVASGTPTPTFQWKKDGVVIAGATSASYLIAATATTDEGEYTVTATNSVSSVTSTVAILEVLVAPKNVVVTLTIQ